MGTSIRNTMMQFGTVPIPGSVTPAFNPSCEAGDWVSIPVAFDDAFPTREGVRVILTCNNFGVGPGEHSPAVVPVATKVDQNGFVIRARNSDCAGGHAGFSWLAVHETEIELAPTPLLFGVVSPKPFTRHCNPGDWAFWNVPFTKPFGTVPAIVANAGNLNVNTNNPAVVATAWDARQDGFTLCGRTADSVAGDSSMYWAALSPEASFDPGNLWIESGETLPSRQFYPGGVRGDWQSWDIFFERPFLTPPVVLVTSNDARVTEPGNVAAVGIARDVTTHGFTLAGRNTACSDPVATPTTVWLVVKVGENIYFTGDAGFFWVAIGIPGPV